MEETTTSNSQRFGFYMVSKGSDFITASLALFIESVSLLYVASNGAIELVCLVQPRYCDKNFLFVIELVDIIENTMSVRDIGWVEGSDHITITTDDQV